MAIAIDSETHAELQRQLAQCEADGKRMSAEINRLLAAMRCAADMLPANAACGVLRAALAHEQ